MATQTPFPQIAAFALWLAVAQAWPALAQDSDDDWDIVRDRRGRAEMAHLQFSNGLAIMVQCKDRSLDVVMGGLPPASARPGRLGFRERPLDLRFRGEEDRRQFWAVGADDTLAVSLLPAPFARQLRQGGTLELGVPDAGDEGQMVTYRVELPPSALNGDEVLNILDIVALVNMILSEEGNNPLGDMNGDGAYNILDVVILANIILSQN